MAIAAGGTASRGRAGPPACGEQLLRVHPGEPAAGQQTCGRERQKTSGGGGGGSNPLTSGFEKYTNTPTVCIFRPRGRGPRHTQLGAEPPGGDPQKSGCLKPFPKKFSELCAETLWPETPSPGGVPGIF